MASGPRKICRLPARWPITNRNMKNPVRAMMYFLPSDELNKPVMIFIYGAETQPAGAGPRLRDRSEFNGRRVQVKEPGEVLSLSIQQFNKPYIFAFSASNEPIAPAARGAAR